MDRFRLLTITVASFFAIASSLHYSVAAPIKAGQSCSKRGEVKSHKSKSFKCTSSKGKLSWQVRSNSPAAPKVSPTPTPTSSPSQNPITELPNIGFNLLNLSSSHSFSAEEGESISELIRISTEVKLTEISGYITDNNGLRLINGTVTLESYIENISTWKIQYSSAGQLVVGRYIKNLEAKTIDGRQLNFLTSPLEIKPKTPAGALRNSKATCSEGRGDCPKPNENSSLQAISNCKISDDSSSGFSQGFPRPDQANIGDRSIKVLWMPIGFTDLPVTEEFATHSEKFFTEYKNFFLEQSYGRARFEFVIPDSKNWLRINQSANSFKNANSDDLPRMIQDLLDRIIAPDLSQFDAIFLITPKSESANFGGMSYPTYQTSRFGAVKGVYLVVGGDLEPITHAMGHNIFYLEDLYIHDFYMTPGRDKWPMQNEIMGGGGPFSGWQRWLNGWLDDTDIRCASLGTRESLHALSALEGNSGERLLVIPTSSKTAWILEVRNDDGPEGNGLFIYSIDTNFGNGDGPMTNIPGTLAVGGNWTGDLIKVSVIAQSEKRLYFSVSRS